MINAYKILVRKPEWKRPLGISKYIWENTVKMDLKFCVSVLTRLKWLKRGSSVGLLSTRYWNFGFHKMWQICWSAERLLNINFLRETVFHSVSLGSNVCLQGTKSKQARCNYYSTVIPRYTSNRFTSFRLYEMLKLTPVFQFTSQFSLIRAPSPRKQIDVPVGKQ
jgi:hypothetical protein